jgi:hypothetical protein
MAFHGFSKDLQCCLSTMALGHIAFQHLLFVIQKG